MEDIAGWLARIATIIAAMMTAANLGARSTDSGFIIFTVGSTAWWVVAISTGQQNLLWTNGFLTLVNAVGIWLWLGRQARYEDGEVGVTARSHQRRHLEMARSAAIYASEEMSAAWMSAASVLKSSKERLISYPTCRS